MSSFVLLIKGEEGLVCEDLFEEREVLRMQGYQVKSSTISENITLACDSFKEMYPTLSIHN